MVSLLRNSRKRKRSRYSKVQNHERKSPRRRARRSYQLRGGLHAGLKRNFRLFKDNYFSLGWNLLTLVKGKVNRSPLTANEHLAHSRLFRLTSDPFVMATRVSSNQVNNDKVKRRTIVFFQGLGSSLSEALDTCEHLLSSIEALGYSCTIFVMDQMRSTSIDLLIASAAEVIEIAAHYDTCPLLLIGFSLGTGVASYGLLRWYESYVYDEMQLPLSPTLVLLSPFTSLSDVTENRKQWDTTTLLDFSFHRILGHNLELKDAIQKMPFKVILSSPRDDQIIAHEQFLELGKVKNSIGELPITIAIDGEHGATRDLLREKDFVSFML